MTVKAEHACTQIRQHVKASGGEGVGQAGRGAEHPREGGHGTYGQLGG